MREERRHQLCVVLTILFVFVLQCQSNQIKVSKCVDETNGCGCTRRPHLSLKLSGGESALLNNWDWMVSIRQLNNLFCAGSILNEWYIITTAHCFDNLTNLTSEMSVCAGTYRLSDSCHQRRSIDSLIIHPQYNQSTIENDLALIRLRTPLDFSDLSITPICLPNVNSSDEDLPIDTQVVSIGWGNLKTNQSSDVLQQVTLNIMDKSSIFCNHISNEKVQLCAGDFAKGITKGDSGGPLMLLSPENQWQLVGLAGFIKPYPTPFSGSGFTFVRPFIQFIQKNLDKRSINNNQINCSCQCPRGAHLEYAFTTNNSLDGCLNACLQLPSNSCSLSNTFTCLHSDCKYSNLYNISTNLTNPNQYSSLVETVLILSNGDKYEGQTRNGKKHGRGTFTWASGDKYIGDWIDNTKTGKGIYKWADGDQYEGDFLHNNMHGQGTMIWATGDKYIGDWFQDSRTGKGHMKWSTGEQYIGDWIDDHSTGKGIFTDTNGKKYVGDFLNNLRIGKGIETDLFGNKYAGDWIDNHKTGKGIYTWTNRDKYIGDWIEDQRTGKGVLILSDGDKYQGQFDNGQKHGQGTYTLTNGNIYSGQWVQNSITGQGIYTWANGDIYDGHFEDGEMKGYGTMNYHNKTIQKGFWPNGPFVYY